MPASLNCPGCGAAAAGPEAARCDYCGSTLTTIGCPACFGTMFAGMEFCPNCGAKAERAAGDATRTIACPGCKGAMRHALLGATNLYECGTCSATWLDTETFTHLCVTREERGAIAAMVDRRDATPGKVGGGAVRYLACPECSRTMNRQNFGKRSGIIIDVCKGHGTYFDARELQSVMAFIDSGGLERAREQEAAKKREEDRARAGLPSAGAPMGATGGMIIAGGQVHAIRRESAAPESLGESLIADAVRMLFG